MAEAKGLERMESGSPFFLSFLVSSLFVRSIIHRCRDSFVAPMKEARTSPNKERSEQRDERRRKARERKLASTGCLQNLHSTFFISFILSGCARFLRHLWSSLLARLLSTFVGRLRLPRARLLFGRLRLPQYCGLRASFFVVAQLSFGPTLAPSFARRLAWASITELK